MNEYFAKPPLDLEDKRIVAVFTAFNEIDRVEYFLSYYRSLGVDHFLAIDNNSSDGSGDLLRAQADVSYFHTEDSYVESKAGRLWTSELATHYCDGKWCLTLDLDELLVFPGEGHTDLHTLCDYLDENGYEGIFTVFLDMYAKGTLDNAVYQAGTSFLETCDHFETASYALTQPMHFPHVGVFGGPRQRIFWDQGKRGRGPSMRKMPLIKWRSSFRYLYSTHSSVPVNLADVTGALLHFKFFSSFKTFAEREYLRGDRVQLEDYQNYVRMMKEKSVVFENKDSIHYASSTTLIERGVMVTTSKYLLWLRSRLIDRHGIKKANFIDRELRGAMNLAHSNAVLTLPLLPVIWPLLASANDGGLIAIHGRTILGWFIDRNGRYPNREVEAQCAGAVVAVAEANFQASEITTVHHDHRDNLFKIEIPEDAFGTQDSCRILLASRQDAVPFGSALLQRNPDIAGTEYEGNCFIVPGGRIGGWVWRRKDPDHAVAVTLFLDGHFWCRVSSNRFRDKLAANGIGNGAHAFSLDLPEGLDLSVKHTIDVTIQGTNIKLDGSPLEVLPRLSIGGTPANKRFLVDRTAVGLMKPFGSRKRPILHEGLNGEVFSFRRGTMHGWIADADDLDRRLSIEVVCGNKTSVFNADQNLRLVSDVPPGLEGHGFTVDWTDLDLDDVSCRLSVRVRETGDYLIEGASLRGPETRLADTNYRGVVEASENGSVRGWVWDPAQPGQHVPIALFIDGLYYGKQFAADFRDDLRSAGIGDGYHSFRVQIPRPLRDGAPHEIDVVVEDDGVPLMFEGVTLVGNSIKPKEQRNPRRRVLGALLSKTRERLRI